MDKATEAIYKAKFERKGGNSEHRPEQAETVRDFYCKKVCASVLTLEMVLAQLNQEHRELFNEHSLAAACAGLKDEEFLAIIIGMGLQSASQKVDEIIRLSGGENAAN